jgi:hypothetical protein
VQDPLQPARAGDDAAPRARRPPPAPGRGSGSPRAVKHSTGARLSSVRRTTSPSRISPGGTARRRPPPRPRTVSTMPVRPSRWTTFTRWFSEIWYACAISRIELRPRGAGRGTSGREGRSRCAWSGAWIRYKALHLMFNAP